MTEESPFDMPITVKKNKEKNADATIVVEVEKDLKVFLEGVAARKGMTLSAYARFVLWRGLDAIVERESEIRLLKELRE